MGGDTLDLQGLGRALARKRLQLRCKRLVDVCGAVMGLLLLGPLLLLLAVLIRLSSPGPAIFRQARMGYRGEPFVMLKFRTMRVESDPGLKALQERAAQEGVLIKMRNDPRVTGIGGVLRWSSLDELPQLVNILKGEMSFVGPRPLLGFMLEPYPDFARVRALVRPGITGLWQVRERHNNTSALAMAAHDLEYIRRLGLGLDLGILLRTAWVVISRQGAC